MLWSWGAFSLAMAASDTNVPNVEVRGPPAPAAERWQAAADYSARWCGRAILIQREGRVLFERYDRGWSAERPHPLASGTKSFTGIMAMFAVQDGLLQLDELVSDTITEWKNDPRKSKVTIRHLLQLSSGLPAGDQVLSRAAGGVLLGWAASNRAARLGLSSERPDDVFRKALELPMIADPGQRFVYGPSHFYVFGAVLERKLQASGRPEKTVLDYLRRRVCEPIGIQGMWIGTDRAGHPDLPGGMLLTARDWAKFGQFVADGGAVRRGDGTRVQLLRSDLLADCFQRSPTNPHYGLTWWLPYDDASTDVADRGGSPVAQRSGLVERALDIIRDMDGKPLRVYMAAGLGKQRLYVLPDYGLVVVRFAEGGREGAAFSDSTFLQLVLKALDDSAH
jgi:CubicO group peptidase (beta-lactamase class C family)